MGSATRDSGTDSGRASDSRAPSPSSHSPSVSSDSLPTMVKTRQAVKAVVRAFNCVWVRQAASDPQGSSTASSRGPSGRAKTNSTSGEGG
eukprot:7484306-Alexandrium_andersonii.AAC.1